MFDIIKNILIWEKDVSKTNYERLKKALVYIKKNKDDKMYLTNDSLIKK